MAESDYRIHDERFRPLIRTSASLERLYTGCRWSEGPVYFPALRTLLWSDIPNDRMLRYDETSGQAGVFRQPARYTNGNTLDRQGRLVSCEHGGRRLVRTEHDGAITVLADRYQGKRFNSPNDVVVHSDGSVWFTDPSYGIDSDYEGHKAESEIGARHVYRIDPAGSVDVVADDFTQPNGLAFSPDEKRLYVADTGLGDGVMRVFDVGANGKLSGGGEFARCKTGRYDGFRVDTEGRIWSSAGEAIHCYQPDGLLIGEIAVPERVSNLVFGGYKRNRLYITATSSLYSLLVAANGAKTF
ncbi:SMP-30/gluconolactonase/LRE family protein [Luteimonas sp. SX5]|uniref:SMP-30/gluconolactonase/LRE family protein n=1 Tax=Luteimonas galliterrae TaxID=2940486 RepID=A0ABT0MLY4_9GAMM|nr:SMP-30/gluconolactonase/LRE family protein [Luteimonas galliterrae]MCL1635678.1 SMP-30/gluconolactonase/LRE family protein [Luteimonas galliterrae]